MAVLLEWLEDLVAIYAVALVLCCFYAPVAVIIRHKYGNLRLGAFTIAAMVVLRVIAPVLSPQRIWLDSQSGIRTTAGVLGLAAAAVVIALLAPRHTAASVNAATVKRDALLAVIGFVAVAMLPVIVLGVLAGLNPD